MAYVKPSAQGAADQAVTVVSIMAKGDRFNASDRSCFLVFSRSLSTLIGSLSPCKQSLIPEFTVAYSLCLLFIYCHIMYTRVKSLQGMMV